MCDTLVRDGMCAHMMNLFDVYVSWPILCHISCIFLPNQHDNIRLHLYFFCKKTPSHIKASVTNDGNGIVTIDSSKDSSNNNVDPAINIDNNEYLKNMMDKKLLRQFNQSLINPEKYQIKFTLRPFQAELQHIFAVPVPGLTREIVEQKQYLKGAIYRLHNAYDENGFDENYFDLVTEFAKEVGSSKRTVIAEASVRCKEFFQVKDRSTGRVIQGMEDCCDEEEVVHLVRFEVVTDETEHGGGEREVGAWKIIDVDDLLEGNVFH